tara:strand:- start:838 stop:1098 length:261 start_codon:yes stop_codon:yes gene_type:complete
MHLQRLASLGFPPVVKPSVTGGKGRTLYVRGGEKKKALRFSDNNLWLSLGTGHNVLVHLPPHCTSLDQLINAISGFQFITFLTVIR